MGLGGVAAVFLTVVGAGCATEEWTTTLFSKRQAEVDERLAQHGQRIDRVEDRVAHLEITVAETREAVQDVVGSARKVKPWQPARAAEEPVPTSRTVVSIVHVPFGFNRADLDASAEATLAAIVKELRERPDATIELEGATDPVGRYEYNVRLSERRVAAVKRWLTHKGIDRTRIVGATIRGPLGDPSVKDAAKRRVMVKVIDPPADKALIGSAQ
jgi:outer membrane protein OmpA-like peptidoglycan-associated protein